MDWKKLLISIRKSDEISSKPVKENIRSPFLNDVDKITFSSYFRKLQDKTQVYPLSQSSYVRTRLTHSLEVATVGRSLGNVVGNKIMLKYKLKKDTPKEKDSEKYKITVNDFGYIIQAAALAHDIGNPPFGHNGESAICSFFKDFFKKHENKPYSESNPFIKQVHDLQNKNLTKDFTNFDGNAQGFKIITSLAKEIDDKNNNGFDLTYPVLATFCKYPNLKKDTNFISSKKQGIFESEKDILEAIKNKLNLHVNANKIISRHPLTFLLEAADDICYLTSDICDAFSVGILEYIEILKMFEKIIFCEEAKQVFKDNLLYYDKLTNKLNKYKEYKEYNNLPMKALAERIELLSSEIVNILILLTSDTFLKHQVDILSGEFNTSLLDNINNIKDSIKDIRNISQNKIYSANEKITQEIKGSVAINHILEEFTNIIINLYSSDYVHKTHMLNNLYFQNNLKKENSLYENLQLINNFIVSCTDKKIIEVFHTLKGV